MRFTSIVTIVAAVVVLSLSLVDAKALHKTRSRRPMTKQQKTESLSSSSSTKSPSSSSTKSPSSSSTKSPSSSSTKSPSSSSTKSPSSSKKKGSKSSTRGPGATFAVFPSTRQFCEACEVENCDVSKGINPNSFIEIPAVNDQNSRSGLIVVNRHDTSGFFGQNNVPGRQCSSYFLESALFQGTQALCFSKTILSSKSTSKGSFSKIEVRLPGNQFTVDQLELLRVRFITTRSVTGFAPKDLDLDIYLFNRDDSTCSEYNCELNDIPTGTVQLNEWLEWGINGLDERSISSIFSPFLSSTCTCPQNVRDLTNNGPTSLRQVQDALTQAGGDWIVGVGNDSTLYPSSLFGYQFELSTFSTLEGCWDWIEYKLANEDITRVDFVGDS